MNNLHSKIVFSSYRQKFLIINNKSVSLGGLKADEVVK